MTKRFTLKSRVLDFVENKGSARYVDVIKFIVDTKFGEGTWEKGYVTQNVYVRDSKGEYRSRERRMNTWRGYFSAAFSGSCPYLLVGKEYLEKGEDCRYRTVRDNPISYPKDRRSSYRRYVEGLMGVDSSKRSRTSEQKMRPDTNPIEIVVLEEAQLSKGTEIVGKDFDGVILRPNKTKEFDPNANMFVLTPEESAKSQAKLDDKQLSLFEIKYHLPNTFGNTQVELKRFTDEELVNWCASKNLVRVRRV